MEEHSLYPGDLYEHQIWRERSHQQGLEGGIPGRAENNQWLMDLRDDVQPLVEDIPGMEGSSQCALEGEEGIPC